MRSDWPLMAMFRQSGSEASAISAPCNLFVDTPKNTSLKKRTLIRTETEKIPNSRPGRSETIAP